jgi:hypothetical protein
VKRIPDPEPLAALSPVMADAATEPVPVGMALALQKEQVLQRPPG